MKTHCIRHLLLSLQEVLGGQNDLLACKLISIAMLDASIGYPFGTFLYCRYGRFVRQHCVLDCVLVSLSWTVIILCAGRTCRQTKLELHQYEDIQKERFFVSCT